MSAEAFLQKITEKHSVFVARNPWKVIFFVILLNALLGLGLLSLKLNNDIRGLYVPLSTEMDDVKNELLLHFPDKSNELFVPRASVIEPLFAEVIVSSIHSDNVFSNRSNEETERLISFINNISVTTKYETHTRLVDVCAKFDGQCVTKEVHSDGHFLQDQNIKENQTAKHRKIIFYLRQETPGMREESLSWSDKFIQAMHTFKSDDIQVVFSDSLSFYDRLNSDTYIPDIRIFGLVFTGFITYCSFLVSGGDCLTKLTNIGRMGIIVSPLSILGSWGLLSGCNVEFTNMIGAMALVAVYLQICNMMFMLSKLSETFGIEDSETRLKSTVVNSMTPTLILTLVVVVPCCFGALSKYKATQLLAIYTALTVLFTFMNHMTLFVACLAIHERRIDEARHCCTCQPIQTQEEASVDSKSGCFICCCTGRKPSSPNDTDHILLTIPKFILSRFALRKISRVVSIILSLGMIGVCIWQLTYINVNVYLESDIKEGSYFYDFNMKNERLFPKEVVLTLFTTEKLDPVNNSSVEILRDLEVFKGDCSRLLSNQSVYWFQAFQSQTCAAVGNNSILIACLRSFVANNTEFKEDISFDNAGTLSNFRLYLTSTAQTPSSIVSLMNALGQSVRLGKHSFRIYSPDFLLTDAYMYSLWELIGFSGIQLLVLIICKIVGSRNIVLSLQVGVFYVITCISIVGFMTLFDIGNLTSVSTVTFMMCINICTPVIVFSYFSYVTSSEQSSGAKAHHMLVKTSAFMASVLFAMSLFLLILFFAESYVFITIFKIFESACLVAMVINCFGIPSAVSSFDCGRSNNQFNEKTKLVMNIDISRHQENTSFDNATFENDEHL